MSKLKREASTAGAVGGSKVSDIKGFSAPFGRVPKSKRGRKRKKNPSKPYGEAELFESVVAHAMLDDNLNLFSELMFQKLGEVVKKRGNMWVYHDDDTGVEKGSWRERETAWEKQRQDRRRQAGKEKKRKRDPGIPIVAKDPEKKPKDKPKVAPKPKMAKKPKIEKPKRKPKVQKVESIKDMLEPLREGSMISYVFENTPVSDESVTWEKFIDRLSKQTVLADPKLKKILQNMAKSEGKMLEKAVGLIGNSLRSSGRFDVEQKKVEIEPDTKDVKLNFTVSMAESKMKLDLAVKLENGRPLIVFPDQTRETLNSTPTDESKLFRAELMHIQETILDNMQEVVAVTQKRDKYLKQLEAKVDKLLNSISPLEISMLRYLLKNKYKGVR